MAEIKCPMCGNPNEDTADTCVHCGARLKPVTGGEAASDWLSEIRDQSGQTAARSEPAGASPFSSPDSEEPEEPENLADADDAPPAAGEVPEWLQRVRQRRAAEQAEPADDFGSLRAGLSDELEVEADPPDSRTGFDLDDGAEPEDLRAALSQSEQAPLEDRLRGFDDPTDKPSGDEADDGIPAWLREAEDKQSAEPMERPEPSEKDPALPHVPALIGHEGPALDADELGLPDWLGEIEPPEDKTPEPGSPDATPGLERATLPNWLEAMRPVDTFRSVVKIDAQEDQAIESVGPLAGLRGVLLAEPVVAMPRSSTTGAMQLEVSERQYAQAELLTRIITEEESSEPTVPKRQRRFALFRWVIGVAIVLATALPILTGIPGFALPALEPKELGPLFDMVGRLPTDRPTLFVFDYDAGNAGELEAVSGPLMDQVMSRGLPVATVSTRPTGSPLAERSLAGYAVRHGYVDGGDLVHLGYLSGGPAAVQLFSLNPRGAILKGFGLPASMTEAGEGAWDSPALANVRALSDFSMVAVITAGPETARLWVEQAQPRMGDTPLVMVLSAGAEPLVRPYYEADRPQIDGILTGLPAAVAYEQRNGRFGDALRHWNSFGAGMLAAELVLLAGMGYGIVRWVVRRREA